MGTLIWNLESGDFLIKMFGLGELPKEYNVKIHGPYDPAVYYGPKDKPLSQVKLGELPGWLMRRNKSPAAMARAVSRAHWRWCHNYLFPKYAGKAAIVQFAVGYMAFYYMINYTKYSHHRNYTFRWYTTETSSSEENGLL